MSYQEINEFLTSFNINSYNRTQIGNSRQLIITIYEFLSKLNINKSNIDTIISNIAYLNKENTNIALYLELLSKSLGFAHNYDLKEVLKIVKEIHDIYFKSSALVPLEEYIHDTQDERIRKLFLNRNNKYLMKNFESSEAIKAISDLKFASAIALDSKEYEEFLSLSNKLAELFPSLTKNYDKYGNAIVCLTGNVDSIVSSLDDLIQKERELANQDILDEMPNVYKELANNVSEYNEQLNKYK
jgi:hypothetical protein